MITITLHMEIKKCGHGRWDVQGSAEIEKQGQDNNPKEDKIYGKLNSELEEFAAEVNETLKAQLEGAPPEPVTSGELSEIVAAVQGEDDDEDQDRIPDAVQLAKSIDWLRSKNISAEDISDFVDYVCE